MRMVETRAAEASSVMMLDSEAEAAERSNGTATATAQPQEQEERAPSDHGYGYHHPHHESDGIFADKDALLRCGNFAGLVVQASGEHAFVGSELGITELRPLLR